MKRFVLMLLSLSVFVSIFPATISSAAKPLTEEQKFVQSFMTDRAYSEWLNKDVDLSKYMDVSETAITTYFLDKIALWREYRSQNGIERENFSVCHDFLVKPEYEGIYIRVPVRETITYHVANGPDESSVLVDNYIVSLIKRNQTYYVFDIITENDWFDEKYRNDGFDSNTLLASWLADSIETTLESIPTRSTSSTTSTVHSYDVNSAIAYALAYATNYNANFRSYANSGGDCMNFASQCVYTGFGGVGTRPAIYYKLFPMDNSGNYLWYGGCSAGQGYSASSASSSWKSCSNFRTYITNMNNTVEEGLLAYIWDVSSGNGNANVGLIAATLLGSVLHVYNSSANTNYGHALFVVNVTSTTRNGIYVCAHTADRYNVAIGEIYTEAMKVIKPLGFRNNV